MKKPICILLSIVLAVLFVFSFYIEDIHAQTLAWGSKGDEVSQMQTKLKDWGFYDGPISGVFGELTFEAVKKFQKHNGLTVDGVVGPQTRAALGLTSKVQPPSTSVGSGVSRSDDVNMLARAIHAEAKGEPYEGMVAVGAVILNRVRHSSFPNTIAGVVYQPCAFEPVKNGAINEAPNDQAFKAARDALNGWDPTGGAIYFWNPSTATSKWIWTRQITLTIGRHVFALE